MKSKTVWNALDASPEIAWESPLEKDVFHYLAGSVDVKPPKFNHENQFVFGLEMSGLYQTFLLLFLRHLRCLIFLQLKKLEENRSLKNLNLNLKRMLKTTQIKG